VASAFYRHAVRPYLPGESVYYAGIPSCKSRKWGDRFLPMSWRPDAGPDEPGYEDALISGMKETVRAGHKVVIVGGGIGITAAVAGLLAGPAGSVDCFEGNKRQSQACRTTARLNNLSNVRIHHCVVGQSIAVYGQKRHEAAVLPASALPECDVLELDCEGAEAVILREMTISPQVVLVETHGIFGAPTELVGRLLEERGYRVEDRGVAESRYAEDCVKNDIRVVLGIRRHESS
jgi:hypothetical protein